MIVQTTIHINLQFTLIYNSLYITLHLSLIFYSLEEMVELEDRTDGPLEALAGVSESGRYYLSHDAGTSEPADSVYLSI